MRPYIVLLSFSPLLPSPDSSHWLLKRLNVRGRWNLKSWVAGERWLQAKLLFKIIFALPQFHLACLWPWNFFFCLFGTWECGVIEWSDLWPNSQIPLQPCSSAPTTTRSQIRRPLGRLGLTLGVSCCSACLGIRRGKINYISRGHLPTRFCFCNHSSPDHFFIYLDFLLDIFCCSGSYFYRFDTKRPTCALTNFIYDHGQI